MNTKNISLRSIQLYKTSVLRRSKRLKAKIPPNQNSDIIQQQLVSVSSIGDILDPTKRKQYESVYNKTMKLNIVHHPIFQIPSTQRHHQFLRYYAHYFKTELLIQKQIADPYLSPIILPNVPFDFASIHYC